jgi:hypothetical protein
VFGFKAPDDITVSVWPKHARYGRRAGLRSQLTVTIGGKKALAHALLDRRPDQPIEMLVEMQERGALVVEPIDRLRGAGVFVIGTPRDEPKC